MDFLIYVLDKTLALLNNPQLKMSSPTSCGPRITRLGPKRDGRLGGFVKPCWRQALESHIRAAAASGPFHARGLGVVGLWNCTECTKLGHRARRGEEIRLARQAGSKEVADRLAPRGSDRNSGAIGRGRAGIGRLRGRKRRWPCCQDPERGDQLRLRRRERAAPCSRTRCGLHCTRQEAAFPVGERLITVGLRTDSPATPAVALTLRTLGWRDPPFVSRAVGDLIYSGDSFAAEVQDPVVSTIELPGADPKAPATAPSEQTFTRRRRPICAFRIAVRRGSTRDMAYTQCRLPPRRRQRRDGRRSCMMVFIGYRCEGLAEPRNKGRRRDRGNCSLTDAHCRPSAWRHLHVRLSVSE